jgi:hypothetical protein
MTIRPRKTTSTPHKAKLGRTRFVVCVKNVDYPASLEKRKIYQAIADAQAQAHNLIRVVDESGEDYLYPADWFVPIPVTQTIAKALALAT